MPLSAKARGKRKATAITQDNNDENGEGEGQGRSQVVTKLSRTQNRSCHFCTSDPVGIAKAGGQPCDWRTLMRGQNIECTNCANHRFDSQTPDHVCEIPRVEKTWRKYATNHPNTFVPAACDNCVTDGRVAACDVDTILGYSCSHCKRVCRVSNRVMEKRLKCRAGYQQWIRRECEPCDNKSETKPKGGCSWLLNRQNWGSPCTNCQTDMLSCVESGFLLGHPAQLKTPENWYVRAYNLDGRWLELRAQTPWRKSCRTCILDGNHCRAIASQAEFACNRCAQLGIDCVSEVSTLHPLFDLSRVGYGRFMPFAVCARCLDQGRNCDRQRPCDSCFHSGEEDQCDKIDESGSSTGNLLKGRLLPCPGPLYYLAMGYGAGGVDDVKDGRRMEHWIGPPMPMYGMSDGGDKKNQIHFIAIKLRNKLKPRNGPPHAGPGGLLFKRRPSGLTPSEIAEMIVKCWHDAHLLHSDREYSGTLINGRVELERIRTLNSTDVPHPDINASADPSGSAVPGPNNNTIQDPSNSSALPDLSNITTPGPGNNFVSPGPVDFFSLDPLSFFSPDPLSFFSPDPNNFDSLGPSNDNDNNNQAGPSSNTAVAPEWGNIFDSPVMDISPEQLIRKQRHTELNDIIFNALSQGLRYGLSTSPSLVSGSHLPTIDDPDPSNSSNVAEVSDPFDGMEIDWLPELDVQPAASNGQRRRWATFNPYEQREFEIPQGFIMQPPFDSVTGRRHLVFGNVQGQEIIDTPLQDIMSCIPDLRVFDTSNMWGFLCNDPTPMGLPNMNCDALIPVDSRCVCPSHGQNPAGVCDPCANISTGILVTAPLQPGDPDERITMDDWMSMRGYLCDECSSTMGASTNGLTELRAGGIHSVWGPLDDKPGCMGRITIKNGSVALYPWSMPITGCDCATKLFGGRLCRFHRLGYASAAFTQSGLVQEWRMQRFGRAVCPGCIVKKAFQFSNVSADPMNAPANKKMTWACLLCTSWVVNQPSVPKLIGGWEKWFAETPAGWN